MATTISAPLRNPASTVPHFDVDVLVIGAGPTGLMAANEALRLGLSVRVVDRKAHRSTYSKALVMHARTLEAMEGLELADRLVAAGTQFKALNIRFSQGEPVRVDLGALDWGDTRYPFWLSIPQYETERQLEQRLGELGGKVHWATTLEGLTQDREGVSAELRGSDGKQQHCRARWLVGCDGGHSRTRELVGVPMDRQSLKQTFILADVKTRAALAQDEGHTWHARNGLLLVVPMPEPDMFRVIAHMPELPLNSRPVVDAPFLDKLIKQRTGIDFGSHDVAWTSQFVVHQGLSENYRAGRVFLAGDAAHVHSPVGGQGLNTGIQDAHNLLWKLALARNIGDEKAEPFLRSYEQERRPVAYTMVQRTSLATRVLTRTNGLLRLMLGPVGSRLAATGRVQQLLSRGVGMMNMRYERSAILPTGQGRRRAAVRAGRRVPNAAFRTGQTLHSLLDRKEHTLVEFNGTARLSTAAQGLDAEAQRVLREAFGVEGSALVLIRPDGIVAGVWAGLDALDEFAPARVARQRISATAAHGP